MYPKSASIGEPGERDRLDADCRSTIALRAVDELCLNSDRKENLPSSMITHMPPEVLLEPYEYIKSTQGKGVRDWLIDAFNEYFQVDHDILEKIKEIVRMLHNASLLIDDIEDRSKMRRGAIAAYRIYGIPNVLNCANYVYFLALANVHKLNSAEAMRAFIDEVLCLHRGQGWDIYWRDSGVCPDEELYRKMVIDKTGGLFRLSIRLIQAFSEDKRDFVPLVNDMSLFYQIRDDYINLRSDTYMENKSYCEDITEGKFSFPIIHSIRADPSDTRLLNILRQRTEEVDTKKHAVERIRCTGSFEYTLHVMRQIKQDVFRHIDALGGGYDIRQILDQLLETSQE